MAQRDDVAVLRQLVAAWDSLLARVMFDRNMAAASEVGSLVSARLGAAVETRSARRRPARFNPDVMTNYLTINARFGAERINAATRERMAQVGPGDAFHELSTSRAAMHATSMAGMAMNFGAKEGARAAGAGMKMWQTNSGNPRASHSAMGGETVPIGELFSNGMDWPGDPGGGAEEVANCNCSLVFL
jgi:hypothetical protein